MPNTYLITYKNVSRELYASSEEAARTLAAQLYGVSEKYYYLIAVKKVADGAAVLNKV